MEMKPDAKVNGGNGGKIAVIGAIITALAGIITTIVSISGPLLDKQLAIHTTQTREAVLLSMTKVGGVAIQLTDTPVPVGTTAAAAQPTQTEKPAAAAAPTVTLPPVSTMTREAQAQAALPTATEAPRSAEGTMLKVGEGVTVNGINVKLTQVEFPAGNEVHLHFTFTNTTNKVVNIALDHNRDVSLTDDKGSVYNWATAFSWEVSIYPGTSRNDEIKRRGDVSKAGYFIIKLEVPGLLSGTWKN